MGRSIPSASGTIYIEGVNFSLLRLKYLLPTTDFNILRLDLLVQTSQQ